MMERLRGSKSLYILLSIVLAVVFWLYVRAEQDPLQESWFYNIPVELTGESVLTRQGLTVSELSAETIDLKIQAPASVLDSLIRGRKEMAMVVDVSKCAIGENKLSYNPRWPSNVVGEELIIAERKPDSVTATVEKLYTKTFDVEFQLHGKVADGYQAGTPAINPETVTISGPVEQVSQVARVVAILEDKNLDERFAGDLPLTLLNGDGEKLTHLEVTLDSTSAYVVVPVVVVKGIDLTVNFIPGGGATTDHITYKIEPPTLIVSGAEEDVRNLESLSLGSVELAKVVGSNTISMGITLDPALENVSGITTADVTVTVSGLATKSFDVENISLINVPSGYSVTAVNKMRTVVVRGDQEELDKLDASQLRIVADMSDITAAGSYPVSVRVYLDANSSVGVIGEYSILVNVSR